MVERGEKREGEYSRIEIGRRAERVLFLNNNNKRTPLKQIKARNNNNKNGGRECISFSKYSIKENSL